MKNIVETVENLIDLQTVGFISSVDEGGYPNTKAMLPPAKREGIKTFYWHTNSPSMRVGQYCNNPKACIYFCDRQSFRGVMLKGTMDVIDDAGIRKAIWKDEYSMYCQGGVDGGDYILLRFTTETGRYYSNFRSEDFEVE
jgi:general stress protein 26